MVLYNHLGTLNDAGEAITERGGGPMALGLATSAEPQVRQGRLKSFRKAGTVYSIAFDMDIEQTTASPIITPVWKFARFLPTTDSPGSKEAFDSATKP